MTGFAERIRKISRLTLNKVSLSQSTIQIILALKDRIERIILYLYNVYYFPKQL